jgi:DNA-binding transcriptional ArsR family regulator
MVKKTLSVVIFVSEEEKNAALEGLKLRDYRVAGETSTGGSALTEESVTRKPPAQRKRRMDDAVAYALGHRIRNEALSILAEGRRSTSELAKIMGEDVKLVGNHIRELYESGCIEDAGTVTRGNITERFYRTVILPYITDEAYRAMSMEERRDVNGVTVQSILAETLASYRAGKMETDDDLWLLWDALNLDSQGRREVAEEFADLYERLLDVKARAVTRMSESGETGITTIITATAFERCRADRPERCYTPSTES